MTGDITTLKAYGAIQSPCINKEALRSHLSIDTTKLFLHSIFKEIPYVDFFFTEHEGGRTCSTCCLSSSHGLSQIRLASTE